MRRVLLLLSFLCVLPVLPAQAAPCTSPAGPEGKIIYGSVSKQFYFCNGTGWMGISVRAGTGSGGCNLAPHGTRTEGTIVYNKDEQVLQGCSGGQWVALGGTAGGLDGQWARLGSGEGFACGIRKNGALWCWGSDSAGQLGNGIVETGQITPMQENTGAVNWARVDGGLSHACGLKTDGTLWCWGADAAGQMGNGATTGTLYSPTQVGAVTTWAQITSGANHNCAIRTNGTLWCWGSDSFGEVGNGATTGIQTSPVQVGTDTNWRFVAGGSSISCGIRTDGTLWCWGADGSGQIGNGATTGNQISPVQAGTDTDWLSVDLGNSHVCGLKTGGTLWCWGSDNSGQLENDVVIANQISPAQEATAATDWAQVSAGNLNTCAVKQTGTLWCWGDNQSGQLGTGSTTSSPVPVQEGSTSATWVSVETGDGSTCAVKRDGTLSCWGVSLRTGANNGAFATT